MPSLKKGNKGVSVDAQERAADAKAKREKAMEKASKSGSAFEDQTVDYSKKPLDMTHVRRLSDLIGYCLFLGFIFCVVFLNPAEKNANNLISGMVQVLDPSKVTSVPAMWDFIDKLTPIIHADKYYNGAPLINSTVNGQYQSYWLNRENLALGRVRLRQIRLKPRMCSTAYAFEKYFKACNPPATWDSGSPKGVLIHDKSGPYGRYDGETPTDQLTGADHYQVNGDGYPWFSPDTKFLYPSEGFVATLPVDAPAATEEVARLVEVGWVDERTRAVFVEFSVYNANIDHFAVARFAFEILPSGIVKANSVYDCAPLLADIRVLMSDNASLQDTVLCVLELLLYVMCIAYLVSAADVASAAGNLAKYLSNGWNLLDAINCISICALVVVRCMYMLRSANLSYKVYGVSDDDGHQPLELTDDDPDWNAYYRVRHIVEQWRVGRNLLAVCCLTNFARAFKFVRASKSLSQLSETIAWALPDLGYLSLIFAILFLGFTLALRQLVGTDVKGYADFTDGCFSLMAMTLGNLDDIGAMFAVQPTLVPIVFAMIVFLLVFIMLTLLLKSVDSAYMGVMERQKYEKDNFVEELREAGRLFLRETYWRLTYFYHIGRVQSSMKKRMKDGTLDQHLIKALSDGKVHPELATSMPGTAGPKTPESTKGDKGEKKKSSGDAQGNKKRGEVPKSDMERLVELKGRLTAGRFVGEDEISETDVAETVAYLAHRQGVLLRRLRALAETVSINEGLLTSVDDSDEEGDMAVLDPTAKDEVAAGFGRSQLVNFETEVQRQPAGLAETKGQDFDDEEL